MTLERFTRTMVRRRRTVVAVWVGALALTILVAGVAGGEHHTDYTMPGSDSARAQELVAERFPAHSGDTVQLLVEAPAGVEEPAVVAAVAETSRAMAEVDHVRSVDTTAVSPDGTVLLATVQLDTTTEKVPPESVEALMELAADGDTDGVRMELGGAAVQDVESAEAGSEQIGLLAALVILLVAFGSVLAAGLPLVVAVFGVGAALAVVPLLNHLLMIPSWAPDLVTMIGIGIGIDYALLVVTRYRSELALGRPADDAVVAAMTTSGRSVLFAGGTVVVSLAGLCVMGLDYLYGTAAALVVGVLVVLVATMTLLPALLGFAGRSIDRIRLPFVGRHADDGQGLWARWSRVVQRRPAVTGGLALVVLLVLAAPFVGLRFGYPDPGSGPTSLTSRRAYDLAEEAFGPGANSPLVVVADRRGDDGVDARLADALAADPGVAVALPPEVDADGTASLTVVVPTTDPQAPATEALVHRLRDDVVPAAVDGGPAEVSVGGIVAARVDESDYLGQRLPYFIGAVLMLSFALLLVVFRAPLVALKAAAMNLLAIGAAYGVMAVALDGGWLGRLIGIDESTPIPVWAPMMMFAVLFGLSMDYEVFLLSRIREEYRRTRDNAASVADGMARTGRVITAAASIMVTVFAAFILGDQVLMKAIGLGLAVAVLLDATVVRMVLVPSTMELLGDRNWWIPRWLDRRLPHLDVEGEKHAGGATPVPAAPAPATARISAVSLRTLPE